MSRELFSWEDEVTTSTKKDVLVRATSEERVIVERPTQKIWIYDLDYYIKKHVLRELISLPLLKPVPAINNTVTSDKLSKILERVGRVTGYKSSLMTIVASLLKYFSSGKTLDDYRALEQTSTNIELDIQNMKYDDGKKQKKTRVSEKALELMKRSHKTKKNTRTEDIKKKVVEKQKQTKNTDAELCIATSIKELKQAKQHISNNRLLDILKRTLSFVNDDSPLFFSLETELMLHCLKYDNLPLFAELYEGSKNPQKNKNGMFDNHIKKIASHGRLSYYMTCVDGISPNTVIDIVKQNLKLFHWQPTFIWHCYQLVMNDGPNIILPASTSSGKTAITGALSTFIASLNSNIIMIYVAPTSATTIQMASTICNDQKTNRISVYMSDVILTSDNPSFICGTPNTLLPLFKDLESMSKNKKIIAVFDEIHVVNYDSKYREIVLRFSKLTSNVIALSATIPNVEELCMQLKYIYNKECVSCITASRPVRRNFYNSLDEPVHAYTNCTAQNIPIDISPQDLWTALNITHPKIAELKSSLTNIPITLESFDNASVKLKDIIIKENIDLKSLFPEHKSKQPTLDGLVDMLSIITDESKRGGPTLVFSPEDPKTLCDTIVHTLHSRTLKLYPYWDELMDAISNICQDRDRSIDREYWSHKSQLDKDDDQDSKRKDTTSSKLSSSRSAENRLKSTLTSVISKLQRKYCDSNDNVEEQKMHMKILDKYSSMEISDLQSDYIVPETYKYKTLNTVSMIEMQTTLHVLDPNRQIKQALAYGIYYIDEDDVPTTSNKLPNYVMIKTIELLHNAKIKVLVLGRYRLSVGMNLPVINVVIYDPDGIISQAEYDQMEGRPGRKGIDKRGNVYRLVNRNIKRLSQAPVNLL